MYRFLLILLLVVAQPIKAFDDAGSESDSYEGLSEYSEETVENANYAFLYGEEHEFDKFIEPLEYAVKKRYRYALSQYAFWVIEGEEYLLKSQDPLRDLYRACNYLLMAAYRREESASDYMEELEKTAKQVDNQGIMTILSSARHQERKDWLKGVYDDSIQNLPSSIKTALDLLFVSVLPKINVKILSHFDCELERAVEGYTRDKDILKGRTVVDLHSYATETLGCETSSKGTRLRSTAGKPDLYFNARVKYPYCLDVGIRTWDQKRGRKFLTGEDPRFVKTDAKAMAAGPVYEGLRDWKPSGKNIKLAMPTRFILEGFYPWMTEFFKGRPEWLMEITHIEDPWKSTETRLKENYAGKWPQIVDKNDRAEIAKQNDIQEHYKGKLIEFIQDGKAAESSISYRLFMIAMMDKIMKEKQSTPTSSSAPVEEKQEEKFHASSSSTIDVEKMDVDEVMTVDLNQITEIGIDLERLKQVKTIILHNITSKNQTVFVSVLSEAKCQFLEYSYKKSRSRKPARQFEKNLEALKSKGVIIKELENTIEQSKTKKRKHSSTTSKESED